MPLDPYEITSLYLSGTIRIPHTPPATGDVYLVRQATPGTETTQDFLRVVHHVSDGMRLAYLLRLKDVRAIKLTPDPEGQPAAERPGSAPLGSKPPRILLAEQLEHLARKTSPDNPQIDELWIADAAVFVPEGAPVVVQTHVGLTAAESVQLRPQMANLRAVARRPCDT
jgi:hypothetical protein